jgi:hypothetical protein
MHNWLIFQYRHVRVKPNIGDIGAALRGDLVELVAGS